MDTVIRYKRTITQSEKRCAVVKINGKVATQIIGSDVDTIRKILESVCKGQDVETISFYVRGAKISRRQATFTKQYHCWRKQCSEIAEQMSALLLAANKFKA